MTNDFITTNNTIYNNAQTKIAPNARVLWDDAQKQAFRFHEIYNFISNNDDSILDIGCGNGELLPYINTLGHIGSYTGIDVNENLITEAQNKFPKHTFHLTNILDETLPLSADNVVISGLFNVNFGQNIDFVQQMLKKSYTLATKRLIFNAISTHVNFTQKEMFYINPSEIFDFCITQLSPIVSLKHGYLSHNFTVCIEKQSRWKSINQD
jgi:SAM-dependent methyltransferase